MFGPAGREGTQGGEVVLTLDEFESLRLADLEGMYQEDASGRMGVSRPTFGRIVESARRKVAEALVHGRTLRIAGGVVLGAGGPRRCPRCSREGVGERTCPYCRPGGEDARRGGTGEDSERRVGSARKGVA